MYTTGSSIKVQIRLSTFMCHNGSTADRFYILSLDATQAGQIRGLFEHSTVPFTFSSGFPAEDRALPSGSDPSSPIWLFPISFPQTLG
ncbi:hypothetical protein ATANTOWER_019426 [Ataeniobius toweri]|uniref:Uncharacterized protein n=1 Tax=Ataeniobius toweri TaxID=208326 RepID=A0ABU7B7I4_9TELE|nr:hypothetical protein [Ataeniobius toweri]